MKIDSYQVQHFAGGTDYFLRAMIWLKAEDNTKLGNIRFYRNADDIQAHDTKAPSGFIACHYPAEQYPHVLDLLRNEHPVFFQFSDRHKTGYISTSSEPTGDGELEHP